MQLTEENINKIAKLARIKVSKQEISSVQQRLGKILGWIEQLEEINTDNIEPMFSVNIEQMPRREDVINDGNLLQEVLLNAPEKEFDMFSVPKVVE